MNANEVVIYKIESQRVLMISKSLAKRIGKPCEPPHAHPHGQVVTFNIARADVLRVRVAGDHRLARPGAHAGAVPPLRRTRRTLRDRAVELHQDGIVDVVAKGFLDGLQVGLVAVAGELHTVRQPGSAGRL